MKSVVLAGVVLTMLAACGGGDGSGEPDPPSPLDPPPTPPPQQASAEGIWSRTILDVCTFDAWQPEAIITPERKLFFLPTPFEVFIGTLSDDSAPIVEATRYAEGPLANLAWDATSGGDALQIGYVQTKSHLSLIWDRSPSICRLGHATLDYIDGLYERSATLAKASGVYSNGELTLAVNADGVVSGSDMSGCVLNGMVTVTQTDRNYYPTAIDVDSCSSAGHYTGVVVIGDGRNGGHNNSLTLATANADHALWRVLEK
jgi:hypothetical protein